MLQPIDTLTPMADKYSEHNMFFLPRPQHEVVRPAFEIAILCAVNNIINSRRCRSTERRNAIHSITTTITGHTKAELSVSDKTFMRNIHE